jgi:hypothetical protein
MEEIVGVPELELPQKTEEWTAPSMLLIDPSRDKGESLLFRVMAQCGHHFGAAFCFSPRARPYEAIGTLFQSACCFPAAASPRQLRDILRFQQWADEATMVAVDTLVVLDRQRVGPADHEESNAIKQMQDHPFITLVCIIECVSQMPLFVRRRFDITMAMTQSRHIHSRRSLWRYLDAARTRWATFQAFQDTCNQFAANHVAMVRKEQALYCLACANYAYERQPIKPLVFPHQQTCDQDAPSVRLEQEIFLHGRRREWMATVESDCDDDRNSLSTPHTILTRDQIVWMYRRKRLTNIDLTHQQVSWIHEWTRLEANLLTHVSHITPHLPMVLCDIIVTYC